MQTTPSSSRSVQPATPSRGFLTFLAAAGFVGAVLLTPSLELDAPLHEPFTAPAIRSSRADYNAVRQTVRRWKDEVVARYDHLPLAQILRRTAKPEIANRVARAIVKEARQLQLPPSLLAGVLLTENSPARARGRSAAGEQSD